MSSQSTNTLNKVNDAPSFDMGGGYKVHVPAPEQEKRIGIRTVDWCRIKRSIAQIKRPPSWLSNTYSISAGISGSGILTLIPLWDAQNLPTWTLPSTIIISIFSAIAAISLILIDNFLVKKQETDVASVLFDIAEIEDPFKHLL